MARAVSVVRRGIPLQGTCADSVTLDAADRHRRRIALNGDAGLAFMLDLPQATFLSDGDALLLDDGRHVLVRAAAEQLYEVHAHDAVDMLRVVWHLGNRHTPAEIVEDAVYIAADHVLRDMLEGLGAHVHEVSRPFNPEGGAYGTHGSSNTSGHSHGHGH